MQPTYYVKHPDDSYSEAYPQPIRDGEPCNHPGCLSHVSHPCEGCGRLAGKATIGEVQGDSRPDEDKREPHDIGRIAYEAAAAETGCAQTWEQANQAKWTAAARGVLAWENAEIERLRALLRRGLRQIEAWQEKYGEHDPDWLPPSGDVTWMEDVSEAMTTPNYASERPAACGRSARLESSASAGKKTGD